MAAKKSILNLLADPNAPKVAASKESLLQLSTEVKESDQKVPEEEEQGEERSQEEPQEVAGKKSTIRNTEVLDNTSVSLSNITVLKGESCSEIENKTGKDPYSCEIKSSLEMSKTKKEIDKESKKTKRDDDLYRTEASVHSEVLEPKGILELSEPTLTKEESIHEEYNSQSISSVPQEVEVVTPNLEGRKASDDVMKLEPFSELESKAGQYCNRFKPTLHLSPRVSQFGENIDKGSKNTECYVEETKSDEDSNTIEAQEVCTVKSNVEETETFDDVMNTESTEDMKSSESYLKSKETTHEESHSQSTSVIPQEQLNDHKDVQEMNTSDDQYVLKPENLTSEKDLSFREKTPTPDQSESQDSQLESSYMLMCGSSNSDEGDIHSLELTAPSQFSPDISQVQESNSNEKKCDEAIEKPEAHDSINVLHLKESIQFSESDSNNEKTTSNKSELESENKRREDGQEMVKIEEAETNGNGENIPILEVENEVHQETKDLSAKTGKSTSFCDLSTMGLPREQINCGPPEPSTQRSESGSRAPPPSEAASLDLSLPSTSSQWSELGAAALDQSLPTTPSQIKTGKKITPTFAPEADKVQLVTFIKRSDGKVDLKLMHVKKQDQEKFKKDSMTLLEAAVALGDYCICKQLLESGAGLESSTPLCLAVKNGHYDIAQLLIKSGVDVTKPFRNKQPLGIALDNDQCSVEIVKYIIEAGFPVNGVVHLVTGETALHSAVNMNHIEVVKYLLTLPVDPNRLDLNGLTPLHYAVKKNDPALVKLLINKGATIDLECLELFTSAITTGNREMVKLFLALGVDIHYENRDEKCSMMPLHVAAISSQFKKRTEVDAAVQKQKMLFDGLKAQNIKMIQEAIAQGADVDCCYKKQPSALHFIAARGDEQILNEFVTSGARVNFINKLGETALHLAARAGHLKCCRLLLEHGAVYNALTKAKHPKTPLDLAKQNNHTGVVSLLTTVDKYFRAIKKGHIRELKPNMKIFWSVMNCCNRDGETLMGRAINLGLTESASRLMRLRLQTA